MPEHSSVYLDGIKGWNSTLTRVNIHGTVDAAKVYGNNTTTQNSRLHDYAVDPNQGGGHTHNDGAQVLSGTRIRILGITISGSRPRDILPVRRARAASVGMPTRSGGPASGPGGVD